MKKEKSKEEWEIENLKSKIDMTKFRFERYIDVLTRSAFIETCTGGVHYNKLFQEDLKRGFEAVRKSKLPKDKKDKIQGEWFHGVMFGKKCSEKEKLEGEIKYWEGLEEWAKINLNNLNGELKRKIIVDCIKQQALWTRQCTKNWELYKKLEETKKSKPLKKKTPKYKISKSHKKKGNK